MLKRYTALDEMMASSTNPMPTKLREHHLCAILSSFAAIRAVKARVDDVRAMVDVVNLFDTLAHTDFRDADGDVATIAVPEHLLARAVRAVADLATGANAGKPISFTAEEQAVMLEVIETYTELVAVVPHRAMVRAWRRTMREIEQARRGKLRGENIILVGV